VCIHTHTHIYIRSRSNSQLNGYSVKIMLHVVKTKIYLTVSHRCLNICNSGLSPCKWVPVTTAWRVLRFRMEESPPVWKAAANKFNKKSWTADEGWSSSLGVGRGANNAAP
jgi:hypothetical protein